jgi:prepilin-type N-terminal cleavage/methylation domain-containing protein
MKQVQNGFTLVELLIVLAILALIAGLIFPSVHGVLRRTEARREAAEARNAEHRTRFRAFVEEDSSVPLLPRPRSEGP